MNKFIWLLFLLPIQLIAQTETPKAKRFSVEVDPSTFVFNGYSANFGYKPSAKWTVGVATFALKFPGVLAGLAIDPNPSTATLRLQSGYSAYLHRSLSEDRSGWWVGVQTGVTNFKITDSRFGDQSRSYTARILMPRFGYKYYVGRSDFYLLPWAGLTYIFGADKKQPLGTSTYEVKPVLPFGAVHLGYSF